MFMGSASKEAVQLGPRKLGEAWRPPAPEKGPMRQKALPTTQLGNSHPGNQTWPCLAAQAFFLRIQAVPAHGGRCGNIRAYREINSRGSHPRSSPGQRAGLLTATEATLNPRLATVSVRK